MNTQSNNNALLPSGFEDLLPPQAHTEFQAIAKLMQVFGAFGYERVKPPLAEFEDSLLAPGPGAALAGDTFRVMDPLSHRMMGLRSDITAQIARIALSRLVEEPRPLRVTYANDVVRTRASQQRTQRQFCQAGCEMIGADTLNSDVEICVVALQGLAALELRGVSMDFALPSIAGDIVSVAGGGDIDALRIRFAGPVDKALPALEKLELSKDAKAHLQRLKEAVSGVQKAIEELELSDVSLTVDPFETKGFEYHNGIAFTLFAQGARGEFGRGGRYAIYKDGQAQESAAGFTFYMDSVRLGLKEKGLGDVKEVPASASWAEIKELQDNGFIVKRGQ